ncbi:hypothetical protein ACFL1G_07015 [Planctomycetota bacterium]
MTSRKIIYSLSIILFAVVTTWGEDAPIVECKVSRITVPLAEHNGKVVCAASFVYGAYVQNPTDQDDFLDSDDLMEKFEKLSEEDRWQYPEYVVIKNFQAWKAGDKEEAISYYEPGYNRERTRALQTQPIEKIQSIMEPFTRVVFIDKSYFGPYVRIYWVMSEVSESGSTKGCKGFPGYSYLKRVGNRYMLTNEIDMTHLFDVVVGTYGARTLMKRESIPLNPDTSGMDCFAMDVDTASPAENKKMLTAFSTEGAAEIPSSFSENYIKVYIKGEPLNIQLEAGKQAAGLSEQMRFFESAVTATQMGTESEILSKWSEKRRSSISRDIQRIKDANEWPESRPSVYNFGSAPTVVCSIQTSADTIIYYKKQQITPPEWANVPVKPSSIYTVGLQKEQGNYTLFNVSSQGEFNVLTNQILIDAVKVLYEH